LTPRDRRIVRSVAASIPRTCAALELRAGREDALPIRSIHVSYRLRPKNHLAEGVEISTAELTIGFQVIALCPLVPRFDENDSVLRLPIFD